MGFNSGFKGLKVSVKIKFILEQAMKARLGARKDGWSTSSPGRFIPEKET